MYLWEGVLAVRQKLNEMKPWLWNDNEVIDALNESANRMVSAAQYLQGFGTFNTAAGSQEYILPADVDQVTGVAYTSGVMFPVQIVPREVLQLGGFVSGIPFYAYLKTTRILAPMTNNATIQEMPMNPNDGGDAHLVIGFYPIPSSVLPMYVWYDSWHPYMQNRDDICQIPRRFKQGWIAYALARLKEKESAFDEAAYFDAQHDRYMQEFVDWAITNRNEQSVPQYSNRPIPPFFLRGSNVLAVVPNSAGVSNM